MVIFFGTETSPSSGDSSPTIMRNSVVFPAPFGPTRPAFSPGLSWNDASTKMSCLPYCLEILLKLIMDSQQNACGNDGISWGDRRPRLSSVPSTGPRRLAISCTGYGHNSATTHLRHQHDR